MTGPEALSAGLKGNESDASSVLTALVAELHPSAAHFNAYSSMLLDFIDSAPQPELMHLAVAALCSLIERSDFSSPEPLAQAAPFVLPPIIHALAATPQISQLSPALETLWLASRSETEQALRQWGLVSSDSALRLAALKQLEAWVSGLNGRFAFRKFTPLVVSLLRDSSEPVRAAAYRLIVKFFTSTSARARDDLVEIMRKQQIPAPTHEKVMSAIARELNSGGHSRPESRSASGSPMISRTPTPQRTTSSVSESDDVQLELEPLNILNEPAYGMQSLDPVNVFSEEEFLTEVTNRLACFEGKETEGNWSQRQEAVQRFRQMLRCTYVTISPTTLRSAVRLMHKPFSETLLSLRTTLVGFTCQAIKDSAQLLPQSMVTDMMDQFLDPLAQVASGIKKITATAAHTCLCAIIIESPSLSARQFQMIKNVAQSKKPHARTYALYWLRAAFTTSQQPISRMDDRASDIEAIVVKGITDAVHTAREEGRKLYWTLYKLWPALATRVSSRLSASATKALQSSKPITKKVSTQAPAAGRMSPAPSTLSSESDRFSKPSAGASVGVPSQAPSVAAKGLGITNDGGKVGAAQVAPQTPKASSSERSLSLRSQSSPRVQNSPRTQNSPRMQNSPRIPASRSESLGVSQSIADLSIHETGPAEFDLETPSAVKAAVKQDGAIVVLRRLASSNCSVATTSMVLKTIREHAPEASSAADIAKLVQTDLSGASMTQRLGYLQLLERLNYEQDTVEFVRPATSPALSSVGRMRPQVSRIAMYVDSESSGSESSPQSIRSRASPATVSPESSVGDSDMIVDTGMSRLDIPERMSSSLNSWTIHPFPSTEPACKTYIESLVQQLEQQTARPEGIAALAVLVTASASPPSRKSPLFTAVDVWHRSYTFDMHLRDVILTYLGTCTETESVILALILLRALLITPTQTPASAYLDPLACIRCLLQVLHVHGGQSLELDEHVLPAARDAVMKSGRSFGSRSLLELLASSYDRASKPVAKAFIIQTLDSAVSFTGLLVDEGAGVMPLIMKALDDGDARVRKEAYPVLVTIQKQNELLGAHAQTRMHAGQRRLLEHYLQIS